MVCGASQGIGWASAVALAERGASVTLMARNADVLEQRRHELPSVSNAAHAIAVADFSDHTSVRDVIERGVGDIGPHQILVNNTGGPPGGPAHAADPEAYRAGFEQHLLCNQVLLQALLPGMREARFGRIINIISTSVVTPIKGLGVSNAIRGAVANWARTLAAELGADGITVNNVLPGFTSTARLATIIERKSEKLGHPEADVEAAMKASVPAGRFGRPEEVAAVVAFLASPAAAYVNGVNLPVDGGRLAAQ